MHVLKAKVDPPAPCRPYSQCPLLQLPPISTAHWADILEQLADTAFSGFLSVSLGSVGGVSLATGFSRFEGAGSFFSKQAPTGPRFKPTGHTNCQSGLSLTVAVSPFFFAFVDFSVIEFDPLSFAS